MQQNESLLPETRFALAKTCNRIIVFARDPFPTLSASSLNRPFLASSHMPLQPPTVVHLVLSSPCLQYAGAGLAPCFYLVSRGWFWEGHGPLQGTIGNNSKIHKHNKNIWTYLNFGLMSPWAHMPLHPMKLMRRWCREPMGPLAHGGHCPMGPKA